MKLSLNGEPREVAEGTYIPDLLAILGYGDRRGVAVAVDGQIVPRGQWASFVLSDGAKVEVLRAVQGG